MPETMCSSFLHALVLRWSVLRFLMHGIMPGFAWSKVQNGMVAAIPGCAHSLNLSSALHKTSRLLEGNFICLTGRRKQPLRNTSLDWQLQELSMAVLQDVTVNFLCVGPGSCLSVDLPLETSATRGKYLGVDRAFATKRLRSAGVVGQVPCTDQ